MRDDYAELRPILKRVRSLAPAIDRRRRAERIDGPPLSDLIGWPDDEDAETLLAAVRNTRQTLGDLARRHDGTRFARDLERLLLDFGILEALLEEYAEDEEMWGVPPDPQADAAEWAAYFRDYAGRRIPVLRAMGDAEPTVENAGRAVRDAHREIDRVWDRRGRAEELRLRIEAAFRDPVQYLELERLPDPPEGEPVEPALPSLPRKTLGGACRPLDALLGEFLDLSPEPWKEYLSALLHGAHAVHFYGRYLGTPGARRGANEIAAELLAQFARLADPGPAASARSAIRQMLEAGHDPR
jgi:hypothetical protein